MTKWTNIEHITTINRNIMDKQNRTIMDKNINITTSIENRTA